MGWMQAIGNKLSNDKKKYDEYLALKNRKQELYAMRCSLATEMDKFRNDLPDVKQQINALKQRIESEKTWVCEVEQDTLNLLDDLLAVNATIDANLQSMEGKMEANIMNEEKEVAQKIAQMEKDGGILVGTDQVVTVIEDGLGIR